MPTEQFLFNELSTFIEQSQQQVAAKPMIRLRYYFGILAIEINKEIPQNKRANYGKQIMLTLSAQLESKYGRNFEQ